MQLYLARDASGAAAAARQNLVTVIVDVVDMSTTLESALEAGAVAVFGASPLHHRAPVRLCPGAIGLAAGQLARRLRTGVVVISEPRSGTEAERVREAGAVLAGVKEAGAEVLAVLPNLGKETPRLFPLAGQVTVAVTSSGGVAYDAAYNAGGRVTIGTVARTYSGKRVVPAVRAVQRAISLAQEEDWGICVVAASGSSLEDLLAARYLLRLLAKARRANHVSLLGGIKIDRPDDRGGDKLGRWDPGTAASLP
jgi:hypothetical protein